MADNLCSITDQCRFHYGFDQRTLLELFRAILNLSPRNIMQPRLPAAPVKNLGELNMVSAVGSDSRPFAEAIFEIRGTYNMAKRVRFYWII